MLDESPITSYNTVMPYTRNELLQKDIPDAVNAFEKFVITLAQKKDIPTEGKKLSELFAQLPSRRDTVLKNAIKLYQSFRGAKIDPADRAFFFSQLNLQLGLEELPAGQTEKGLRNITNAQPQEAALMIADALYDRYQAKERKGLSKQLERYMTIFLNFNKHLEDQLLSVDSPEYAEFVKAQYYQYFPMIRERFNERVRNEVSEAAVPAVMAELDAILQVLAPEAKFSTGEKKTSRPTEGLFNDQQAEVIDANGELQRRKAEEDAQVAQYVADLQKKFADFERNHSKEPLTKLIKIFILHLMKQESKADPQMRKAFEEVATDLMRMYAAEFSTEQQEQEILKLKEELKGRLQAPTDLVKTFDRKS